MTPNPADLLQLRDIHIPGEPALWPPAPGWWFFALISVLIVTSLTLWSLRRWRNAHFRSRVLRDLQQLPEQGEGSTLVARVSVLLKRVALARYSRSEVASLSGEAWLAFLDRTGGGGEFQRGAGQILATGPYTGDAQGIDSAALIDLSKNWIRKNL